jgi:hypothetical protein
MPPAGFEPTNPASGRPQILALDRSATGIGREFQRPHRKSNPRTSVLYCSTSTKCDTAYRRFEPRTLRPVACHYTYCKGTRLIKCRHCTEIPHASHTRSDRGENPATLSKLISSEFWSWPWESSRTQYY